MTPELERMGLVLLGDRQCGSARLPMPEPEARAKFGYWFSAAGICGSDLHFYRSSPAELGIRRGVVIGHEPSGIVEAVGPGVTTFSPAIASR